MNLPDLCRYYLRCLSVAYQGGVVVAQNSITDHVELPSHPSCDPGLSNLCDNPGGVSTGKSDSNRTPEEGTHARLPDLPDARAV